MYAVIAEARSDAETLAVLVRRLHRSQGLKVREKGYNGRAELLRKGARQLVAFRDLGVERFVVCQDADGPNATERYQELADVVVRPSGVERCCIVIPVQELEAWLLSDIECATGVFTGWRPAAVRNPEAVASPKDELIRRSRAANNRPRYSPPTHNPVIARYLDLEKVARKCPSFVPLKSFVTST